MKLILRTHTHVRTRRARASTTPQPRTAEHPHQAYDVWCVGIIMMELILGTSRVFQVDARTESIMSHSLKVRLFIEHCFHGDKLDECVSTRTKSTMSHSLKVRLFK